MMSYIVVCARADMALGANQKRSESALEVTNEEYVEDMQSDRCEDSVHIDREGTQSPSQRTRQVRTPPTQRESLHWLRPVLH
jgi:hypothetical protein